MNGRKLIIEYYSFNATNQSKTIVYVPTDKEFKIRVTSMTQQEKELQLEKHEQLLQNKTVSEHHHHHHHFHHHHQQQQHQHQQQQSDSIQQHLIQCGSFQEHIIQPESQQEHLNQAPLQAIHQQNSEDQSLFQAEDVQVKQEIQDPKSSMETPEFPKIRLVDVNTLLKKKDIEDHFNLFDDNKETFIKSKRLKTEKRKCFCN